MDLNALRDEIDSLDKEILKAFEKRMEPVSYTHLVMLEGRDFKQINSFAVAIADKIRERTGK